MSGIDLLLRTAIDYERTHQLALFTLLSKSSLPAYLVGTANSAASPAVLWEPEGQLFDLAVVDGAKTTYIELKMWSGLSDSQQKRQHGFLLKNGGLGLYILLGTSWFEHSTDSIAGSFGGIATKTGYEEVISALNRLMVAPGQSPDVYELALAYRNALQEQMDKLLTAFKTPDGSKLFFYSMYHEIQKRLKSVETAIYTVNNPGGPVYILNCSDHWLPFSIGQLAGELYYEVVNGRLCIKFHSEATDKDKYTIRDRVRKAIKGVLGQKYRIVDSGRLGAYMTACQIDHDFCDISALDESAAVFEDVANEFKNIIKAI